MNTIFAYLILKNFCILQYNLTMDDFIKNILELKLDPYEILSDYCINLQESRLLPTSLTLSP